MRNIVLVLFAVILAVSCKTEPQYKINGNVEGVEGMVYLKKQGEERDLIKVDSATVENNMFILKGKIDSDELYYLQLGDENNIVPVFMSNADIKVTGNIENLKDVLVEGSVPNDLLKSYTDAADMIQEKQKTLYTEYKELSAKGELTPEKEEQIKSDYEALNNELQETGMKFINNNVNSTVAAFLTTRQMYAMEFAELEELFNKFAEPVKNSTYGKKISDKLELMKKTAVGQPFIDFSMADVDGKELRLADYTGKGLLLLDFWASWCGPCRAENPNLVAAYEKYHDKGFEIFGVSFDGNKDKWIEAIEADKMNWIHVSDLKAWQCAAGKLYGIQSIPSNVLIDKEGKIIAKNLRGEELEKKLAEILG